MIDIVFSGVSMDGVRAPARTSAARTASTTTARLEAGPAGAPGAAAAGRAGLVWPSGRGAAATPDLHTGGRRAGATANSSDCATSTGHPTLRPLIQEEHQSPVQVYHWRRLQSRAVSVRVLYRSTGGG